MKNILRYLLVALLAMFVLNMGYLHAEETIEAKEDEQEEVIKNESSEEPKTIIEEVKEQENEGNDILVGSENNENVSEDKKLTETIENQDNENVTESQNELVETKEEDKDVTNEATEKVETKEEDNKVPETTEGETTLVEEQKEEVQAEEPKEEVTPAEEEKEEENEPHAGEVILAQTVKTIITKVDENGNHLAGAKLQVIDSTGKVVDEWTSDGKEHIVMLPDGTYKLHEVEAPEGYDLAEDKEFIIKIEVLSLNAGVDVDPYPCNHYQDGQGNYGVMLYYVEIDGKKHEVYCINQELGTPDQNSIYDGEILNKSDIRNFTTQTIKIDAHYNEDTRDISDQSLSDQELYDKLLDIIYHRHKAISAFTDLTESEIRYVTEMALKNYTNTGLTQIQRVKVKDVPNNYDKYDYYVTADGKFVWYLYPMYRSFVYLPDAADGEDIFTTSLGDGNSFGNLARHWNGGDHNAKGNPEVRQKIARYYELYNYLISDENGDGIVDHPSDMNLYIYSTKMLHTYMYQGVEYTEPYQNLLGITGYFEGYEPKEETVKMVNKYSTKKTSIPVKKIWNDGDNQDGKRPDSIKVTLYADKKPIQTISLTEENYWSYTFNDLLVYVNGKKVSYTISEEEVKGYTTKIDGYTITNTYKPEKTSILIKKIWNDGDNQDGKRPDSIDVILYADKEVYETISLNKDNNWSYTFNDLDVYKKGVKIEYKISEVEVNGYTTKIDGFTITNTYTPEKRSIPVIKIWDDKEDFYKLRPKTITIELYADDELCEKVILNKNNDWKHTFENLPVYKNGKEITYTINEVKVDKYYTEIEGDMEIGFTITNTHFGEGGDVPKTLDSVAYYILLLVVSMFGLIKYSYSYIKNN